MTTKELTSPKSVVPKNEASLFIDEIVNNIPNRDGFSIEDCNQFYIGINSMSVARGSNIQLDSIIDIVQSYGEHGIKGKVKISLKSMIKEIITYAKDSHNQVTETDLILLTWGNPYVYNAVNNVL